MHERNCKLFSSLLFQVRLAADGGTSMLRMQFIFYSKAASLPA